MTKTPFSPCLLGSHYLHFIFKLPSLTLTTHTSLIHITTMPMEETHNKGSTSQSHPQNLIASCAAMLSLRDFTTCRRLAHRLPKSDPLDRFLAVVDVLSAADLRLNNNHPDWYSVLQLRRDDAGDRDLLRRQFKTLVRLLDPTKNEFPFSDVALMRVQEAWSVLSDPERRALYERQIEKPHQQQPCKRGEATSFWTLCPYCWNLYEYEKRYEDCSLRCLNCRKTFHGVAVKPPVKEMVVDGEEQYYCYHASVPLRYQVSEEDNKKNVGEQDFVYISDDDDGGGGDGSKKCGDGEGGFVGGDAVKVDNEGVFDELGKGKSVGEGVLGNGRGEVQSNGKRRMRIKTVAKKSVGNWMRRQRYLDTNSDSDLDLDAEDGELEFTQGDGDIFVGVRSTK